MSRERLEAAPLSSEGFAAYGEVVEARGVAASANQGTADRFDRVTHLSNERPNAALNVAVFRCVPFVGGAFPVKLLERHPRSTQLFVPMNAQRYLVIVALGGEAPDLATLRAFIATGAQGVSYRAGVWHHPMIALDEAIDFVCFVHEDGGPEDCVVHPLEDGPMVPL